MIGRYAVGKKVSWLVAAALSVTALALVACGGIVRAVERDGAQPALQEQPASQAGSAPGQVAQPLGPDDIVAAQEQVLSRIHEQALPSVVHIRVTQQVQSDTSGRGFDLPFEFGLPRQFFQEGEGSGFVWDDQGHVVTNHHVVAGADRVTLIFADGTMSEARVVGSDPDSDLAVLEADLEPDRMRPAALGDSAQVKVGQMVAAIGNPFGQEFTMTSGIVSAVGRTISSGASQFSIPLVIQTDAAINPGNSGGPLLDRQGRVIGINTQIVSRSGASAGIGFAVPINMAKKVIPELIADGSYEYAWLGIQGTTLTPDIAEAMGLPTDTRGALVIEVVEGSPAAAADLRGSDRTARINGIEGEVGGDVITAINGTAIRTMDDLIAYLIEQTRPGDQVTLNVLRDGGQQTQVAVTLGTRPQSRV